MRILSLSIALALSTTPAWASPSCSVSLAQFSTINIGDNASTLYTKVGCYGTVTGESAVSKTEMWEGSDPNSFMIVSLVSGKIATKGQYGLR